MKQKLLTFFILCCVPLLIKAQENATAGNKPASEPPVIEHIGMLTVDYCAGDCVALAPEVTGEVTSFEWIIPAASSTPAGSGYTVGACIDSAGTYPATFVVSNSAGSDTMTVYVHLNPNPVPVLTESEGVLTVNGEGILYYTWFLNGAYLTGSTSNTLTPAVEGWYRCKAQAMGGCEAWADSVYVTPASVPAVTANSKPAFWVADRTLYAAQVLNQPLRLTIVDGSGGRIWEQEVVFSKSCSLPYLPAGHYLIGIQLGVGKPIFLKWAVRY